MTARGRVRRVAGLAAVAVAATVVASGGAGATTAPSSTATTTGLSAASPEVRAVVQAAADTGRLTETVALDLTPGRLLGKSQPSISGRGTYDLSAIQGKVELRESTGTEQVVFIPQALYVREPPPATGASALPAGKSWISAGLNEKPGPGSPIPQFVNQVEAVNAALLLDEIAWGTVKAVPEGTAQLGAATTHRYAVTVDLRKAANGAPASKATTFSQSVGYQISALSPRSGDAKTHVTVWIDDQGHVARLQSTPPGSGVGSVSITLSHYGARVRAPVPPSSKVVDIANLSPGGESESGLGDVA